MTLHMCVSKILLHVESGDVDIFLHFGLTKVTVGVTGIAYPQQNNTPCNFNASAFKNYFTFQLVVLQENTP